MNNPVQIQGLQIDPELHAFILDEALPGTGVSDNQFWEALEEAVERFGPRNRALLETRSRMQRQIDEWHRHHPQFDAAEYKRFLSEIGYLLPEGEDFTITTSSVDPEIATIAGPQLVVPITNDRYALNAANARWGSLYDSLYGTDVIEETDGAERAAEYNPKRGEKVVNYAMALMDELFPLTEGSHGEVREYRVDDQQLKVELTSGTKTTLRRAEQFAGYVGAADNPDCVLLRNNGLHLELQLDREHPIGKTHSAGIKDILMEAAVTTIQDLEDSVATVNAQDKVLAYRNWLGLMQGHLEANFQKSGRMMTRRLNNDRRYQTPDDQALTLPGRSLLLIRNVGHLMTTDAVLDTHGDPIPEGILDGVVTTVIAMHDIKGNSSLSNSRAGSIYIVKPKMHGPDEVIFTNELFEFVEHNFGLDRNTIKMGIMDEERRTSLNLKECIRAAKERVVFINTGFLDRTGDEIHTSMEAGPMVRKGAMKESTWIKTYEDRNVDIGLACGFKGKAQIGKGMWAMPDEMKKMMESKINHPMAGANTAWVPSPTAAVLHAIHYHKVNVAQRQDEIAKRQTAHLDDLLELPLLGETVLDMDSVTRELENNAQGILGYVVRWINQGIGCSKVPDINDTGLMEDRATLRISSQHIANWLYHGLCSEDQVLEVMKRMAKKVDQQNGTDPTYTPMAPEFDDSIAFQAACDLVFKGREQPNGYTEPLLYQHRRATKSHHGS